LRTTEPFVPIPEDVIPMMLSLASVRPNEMVVDLGSGDGRIIMAAAELFRAKAIGVEARAGLVGECRKSREKKLSGRVRVVRQNFRTFSLKKADVLVLYLSGYTMGLLARRFRSDLRTGARIVTFDFPIPDWTPAREQLVTPKGWKKSHPIYLYVV
jgi:precorrin-6B methylase 2